MRTIAVIAVCLAVTAVWFDRAVINPDVPLGWVVLSVVLAAGALLLRGGSVLAGGLLANALVAQLTAGVPDFIPIAGRLLSPGDVAIVLGFLPLAVSLAGGGAPRAGASQAQVYSKPVIADSFASDC